MAGRRLVAALGLALSPLALAACDVASTSFNTEPGPIAGATTFASTKVESRSASDPLTPGLYLTGGVDDALGRSTAATLLSFGAITAPTAGQTLATVRLLLQGETLQGDTTSAPMTVDVYRIARFTRYRDTTQVSPYLADTTFTVAPLLQGEPLGSFTLRPIMRKTSADASDTVRVTLTDPAGLLTTAAAGAVRLALVPRGTTQFVDVLASPRIEFGFTTTTGTSETITSSAQSDSSGSHVQTNFNPTGGAALVTQGAVHRAAIRFDQPILSTPMIVERAMLEFTVDQVRAATGLPLRVHVMSAVQNKAGRTLDSLRSSSTGLTPSVAITPSLVSATPAFATGGRYRVDVTGIVQSWVRPQLLARQTNHGFIIQAILDGQSIRQYTATNESLSGFTIRDPQLILTSLTPAQVDSTLGGRP